MQFLRVFDEQKNRANFFAVKIQFKKSKHQTFNHLISFYKTIMCKPSLKDIKITDQKKFYELIWFYFYIKIPFFIFIQKFQTASFLKILPPMVILPHILPPMVKY